jgi:glycosyltransferase involved in cell wall biosynthesis
MKDDHDVFVLHFDIFDGNRKLKPIPDINYLAAGGKANENLSKYYLSNRTIHKKRISEIINKYEIDVVLGANILPTISAYKAVRKRRRNGKKCLGIYDFSDFFPQSAAVYSENKLAQRLVKLGSSYFFHKNLKLADVITTVSMPLQDYARKRGCKHVELISNGVNREHFKPDLSPEGIKEKHGLGDQVLGFVGALERWIDLETPLRMFPQILRNYPDTQFFIVGGSIKSNYETFLQELVKDLNISDNVIFTGFVPYEEVPYYINAIDVALIPFRTDLYMAQIALPNKLFEYLACGRHVLSTDLPEVRRVGGSCVSIYNSKNEFINQATLMLRDPSTNNRGINLVKKYDWTEIAQNLVETSTRHLNKVS